MAKVKLGRFLGMEDEGGYFEKPIVKTMSIDADELGQPLDVTESAENYYLSAEGDFVAANAGSSDCDELIESSQALEDFLHAARQASRKGGWTRTEAQCIALGLNNLTVKIGFPVDYCTPSLESFTGTRERINSTYSVENAITDALKSIWTAIINSVNKVVKYVRDWYLKVLDGTTRLKKRAEAIRTKANTVSGSPRENTVKTGVLRDVHINKAPPTPEQLSESVNRANDILKSLTGTKASDSFGKRNDAVTTDLDKILDDENVIKGDSANKLPQDWVKGVSGMLEDVPTIADGVKKTQADLAGLFPTLASGVTPDLLEGTCSTKEQCGGKLFWSIRPKGVTGPAAGADTKPAAPAEPAAPAPTETAPAPAPAPAETPPAPAPAPVQGNESMFGGQRYGRRFSFEAAGAGTEAPATPPPAPADPAPAPAPAEDKPAEPAKTDAPATPAPGNAQQAPASPNAEEWLTKTKDLGSILTWCKVFTREPDGKAVEVDNDKDFRTLTPGQVVQICDSVIAACETIIAYKAGYGNYEKQTTSFTNALKKYSSKGANGELDAKARQDAVRSIANGVASGVKNNSEGIMNYINYAVKVSRGGLTWANQSLGQY